MTDVMSPSGLTTASADNEVDPLSAGPISPDRVYYAPGVLLDAPAFDAEQTYHRGRLARVLAYLQGRGTVAGLKVSCDPPKFDPPNGGGEPPPDQELTVAPGLAVDRLGRFVEVPRSLCLRLNRWYQGQDPDDLIAGFHQGAVVVDVFIRFVACERGMTPAFASGPFDSLDAAVPSRIRDGFELSLVIRKEGGENDTPPLPVPDWPDFAAEPDVARRRAALHQAIFDAWRETSDATGQWGQDGQLKPQPEHALGQDPTSLFLARVTIPATKAGAGQRPTRTPGADVVVDNESRRFAYAVGALARWVGI